jgi:hypothetical protein
VFAAYSLIGTAVIDRAETAHPLSTIHIHQLSHNQQLLRGELKKRGGSTGGHRDLGSKLFPVIKQWDHVLRPGIEDGPCLPVISPVRSPPHR